MARPGAAGLGDPLVCGVGLRGLLNGGLDYFYEAVLSRNALFLLQLSFVNSCLIVWICRHSANGAWSFALGCAALLMSMCAFELHITGNLAAYYYFAQSMFDAIRWGIFDFDPPVVSVSHVYSYHPRNFKLFHHVVCFELSVLAIAKAIQAEIKREDTRWSGAGLVTAIAGLFFIDFSLALFLMIVGPMLLLVARRAAQTPGQTLAISTNP